MGGACRMYWGEVHTGSWWGKAEVKRTLGKPWLRWEDIKMDFQEMG